MSEGQPTPPIPAPDDAPVLERALVPAPVPPLQPDAFLVPRKWAWLVVLLAAAALLASALLWQKLGGTGIRTEERDHPADVPLRKSLHLGQLIFQIAGEAGNDRRAVALFDLALFQYSADVPVQPNQFGIHREHGPDLSVPDTLLHLAQQVGVIKQRGWFLGGLRPFAHDADGIVVVVGSNLVGQSPHDPVDEY